MSVQQHSGVAVESAALAAGEPARAAAPRARPPRARLLRRALWLALLAFVAYVPAIRWGEPYATAREHAKSWGVDDESPLGPLADINNLVRPQRIQYLSHPLMQSFLAAAAQAPYLVYLRATGQFGRPATEYPFGLAHPIESLRMLSFLAHLTSLLLAIGAVLAAFFAAAAFWDERTATVAAVTAMLPYPIVYYAHTGNVDMAMLAFTGGAIAVCAWCVSDGATRARAIALGALAGCAVATKESAGGAVVLLPAILALAMWQRRRGGSDAAVDRVGIVGALVAAGTAGILALGIGSGLFLRPARYLAHLRYLKELADYLAVARFPAGETFPATAAGHLAYARALLGSLAAVLTLPALGAAVVGAVLAVRRKRAVWALLLPGLAYLVYVFFSVRYLQIRHYIVFFWVAAVFAGYGLVAAWRAPWRAARLPLRIAALATLALLGAKAADLSYQMVRDSHYVAGRWLAERLRPGDTVSYFGAAQKLPPLPLGVTAKTAVAYAGMFAVYDTSMAAAQRVLQQWRADPPRFIIIMPDHTGRPGAPYDATVPPALFRSLEEGTTGFRRVLLAQTPRLFPWSGSVRLDYPVVNPPIRIYALSP